jgi:hypothetical protein
MLDRGLAPNYGSGPVFIAHLNQNPDKAVRLASGDWLKISKMHVIGERFTFPWDSASTGYGMFDYITVNGKITIGWFGLQLSSTGMVSQTIASYTISSVEEINNTLPRWQAYTWLQRKGGGSYYERTPADLLYDPDGCLNWLVAQAPNWGWSQADLVLVAGEYEKGEEHFENDFSRWPFKYGEHAYWSGFNMDLPSSGTHIHAGLFSAAYYAAQDKLPQLLSNTFQNLIEAGQTVISLANGLDMSDLRHLRKLAGSSWLAYRYQYNTTVSDLEELEGAIERFDNLSRLAGSITSYGTASDSTGSYHCALVVNSKSVLDRPLMKKMNLRPTLANAWDMIPYSFIVDWFTNIGEVLAAIDHWLDSPSFGDVNCWYSYTNRYTTEEGELTCYFRFQAGRPLLPYWSMDFSRSDRVWAMRATDIVSLLA